MMRLALEEINLKIIFVAHARQGTKVFSVLIVNLDIQEQVARINVKNALLKQTIAQELLV